ncbi:MAG: hypothetical protein ACHQQS_15850 [Thermoanaerobaculales bacterium]
MISRRFIWPLAIAVAASLATVVLACLPLGGHYDAALAVLTATAVAVIWYTYFSYVAAHRVDPGLLLLGVEFSSGQGTFSPTVRNPTPRTLKVRLQLKAWVDDLEIPADDFFSGKDEWILGPHGEVRLVVPFYDQFRQADYDTQTGKATGGSTAVLVRLRASWIDESGDPGTTAETYWRINLGLGIVSPVLGQREIARHFGTRAKAQ